ncbi:MULTISPECIES: HlyD family secretion protein [Methylobacterium]|uniref:HlyD family secretion protein n=1 Tax=Methylobacterium TaxID=407 RepID=UPI001EE198B3|nr:MULTISPECIES: HlyD family secretion protein [Methylobacterium]
MIGIAAVVLLLLAGGGLYYWLSTRGKISTDDAYTDGNIVNVAPQVAGQVIALDVTDNQFVHKGDPLFRIDPRQFVYSREQAQGQLDANNAQIANQRLGVEIAKKNFPAALQLAQANLDSAKANLALQQANFDRQKSLPKLATTQQEVDTTAANYQQAKAQVEQAQARLVQAMPVQQNIGQSEQQVDQLKGQAEQAKAQVDQANLNIEWSVVRASQDGWVTKRNVNAGDYLTAGQQVMSLVTTDVWVTANYKETELDGMRPGQRVKVAIDAYPDLDLQGHVDSIQRGSGSKFSAFPAENATGNFIKIVQRVPVKIVIDSGLRKDEPLPLGVSVEPTVMLK